MNTSLHQDVSRWISAYIYIYMYVCVLFSLFVVKQSSGTGIVKKPNSKIMQILTSWKVLEASGM